MDELPIQSGDDVVRVRQHVRVLAAKSGLSLASELARNALVYGGGGVARIEVVTSDTGRNGVRIDFTDDGPGIPDLDLALTDGWTSGGGLGLGLSGARRLVDEFELTSKAGAGTSVVVVKWSR
jgi:serine/threonine-protein kinase RsbT